MVHANVSLNPSEYLFFKSLKAYMASPLAPASCDLRVAGGWVRDKLLQEESSDIDIVVSGCTAEEFCTNYCMFSSTRRMVRGRVVRIMNPTIASRRQFQLVILCLPSLNLTVDVVNACSRDHDQTTLDQQRASSFKADAMLRDFTINSLLYDIRTNEIDDFTSTGLSHLKEGIIATPIDPLLTFNADPIRIIRGVRFAATHSRFRLSRSFIQCVKDENHVDDWAAAFQAQRVYQELAKIAKNGCLFKCMSIFKELELWRMLFNIPSIIDPKLKYVDLTNTRTQVTYHCTPHFISTLIDKQVNFLEFAKPVIHEMCIAERDYTQLGEGPQKLDNNIELHFILIFAIILWPLGQLEHTDAGTTIDAATIALSPYNVKKFSRSVVTLTHALPKIIDYVLNGRQAEIYAELIMGNSSIELLFPNLMVISALYVYYVTRKETPITILESVAASLFLWKKPYKTFRDSITSRIKFALMIAQSAAPKAST